MPNHGYRTNQPSDSLWAELRESQAQALQLPHTHMVVSIDTVSGDPASLHPREKTVIARRLSDQVLKTKLSNGAKPCTLAPISVALDGDRLIVQIDTGGKVLNTVGSEALSFAIAGSDHVFRNATVKLNGNKIILTSSMVKRPVAARYGWEDNPHCNVYCGEQPLPPFRTDSWPTHPNFNKYDLPAH
jgi:sialate O-acetylesterase